MTANGKNGFLLTTGFPIQQVFQQLLHQFGGTEFNADGTQATWNSDAGVQALTWMKQASDKYGQPNLEVDADLNAFKAGTAGMIWNGIWQLTSLTGPRTILQRHGHRSSADRHSAGCMGRWALPDSAFAEQG